MQHRKRIDYKNSLWITAAGVPTRVGNMSDQHLAHTLRLLKKWSVNKRLEILALGEGYYSHFDGWEVFAPNVYWAMKAEANERKLVWDKDALNSSVGARVV